MANSNKSVAKRVSDRCTADHYIVKHTNIILLHAYVVQ